MMRRPLLNASCLVAMLLSATGCRAVQSSVPRAASAALKIPDNAELAITSVQPTTGLSNIDRPATARPNSGAKLKTSGGNSIERTGEQLAVEENNTSRPIHLPPVQTAAANLNRAKENASSRFEPLWITRR
ncbi:MAG: hypothetical protein P1U77_11575 [Rubripirellula sp.]|nr:hypothetical protein [Planctomycetaceae bacterium]MDF1842067.1 hypothetical protein [Rubripirellula sp.]